MDNWTGDNDSKNIRVYVFKLVVEYKDFIIKVGDFILKKQENLIMKRLRSGLRGFEYVEEYNMVEDKIQRILCATEELVLMVLPQSQLLTHNEPCSGSATNVVDSVDNASVERRLLERLLALDYLIDIYPVGISLLRYSHEDAANDNIEFIRDEDGQHGIVAGHKDGNIEIDWLHDEPSGTSAFTFVQKELHRF